MVKRHKIQPAAQQQVQPVILPVRKSRREYTNLSEEYGKIKSALLADGFVKIAQDISANTTTWGKGNKVIIVRGGRIVQVTQLHDFNPI